MNDDTLRIGIETSLVAYKGVSLACYDPDFDLA